MKLKKTKYPTIYKSENKHYLRKTINGKPIKKLIGYNLTDKQAELKSQELLNELTKEPILKKTLIEYINEYIEIKKILYSKNWEYTNRYNFHKLEQLHNVNINTITTNDLQRIINALLDVYSPQTVHHIKNSISALYSHFKLENVAKHINIPKYDNQLNFTLETSKINDLVKAIKEYQDIKYRCFFMLGLHGRRKGEISNLKWKDIDLNNCVLHIDYSTSKNKRNMTYPILPELRDNLYQLYMEDYPAQDDYVFISTRGTKLYWVQKRWKKLCSKLGIDIRFHSLRHMLGYIAINKGMTLEQIGATLGHSNLSTTRRYAKLKEETSRIVLKEIYGN